jgi:hypothetical protein
MKISSFARRLPVLVLGPLILATVLIVYGGASAQGWPLVVLGNPDHSPIYVPAQGDVTLPMWVELPGWINSSLLSFIGNHFIVQWLGVEILYPWDHNILITGNQISLSFSPTPPYPDPLFHLADFTFHIDAESSYWGQPRNVIFPGPTMFVDSLGWVIDDITPLISPLCIECATAVEDPPWLPNRISHSAYPNPFNASVAISLSLPRAGDLNLAIYDISGRRVKTLYDGAASRNLTTIWDGSDGANHQVATGVYFYHIEYENRVYTSKTTLLR